MKTVILALAFFINLLVLIDGAKILIIMGFESKSHNNIHEATARALGSKGHEVTIFTTYPMSKQWPNVQWHRVGNADEAGFFQLDIYESRKETLISMVLAMTEFFLIPCDQLYTNDKMKSILEEASKKGKQFDVAILDTFYHEYALPLASAVANHTMYLSVLPIPIWMANDLRIPYPTSTLPSSFMSSFPTPKTFLERLESTIGGYAINLFHNYYVVSAMQTAANKYLPGAPSIKDLQKKVSFILANEDPVIASSRPTTPFIAKIGGIHLQKAKALPKDLEDFMQSSGEHGVILFSFGSYFDTRLMPKEMRDTFVAAFARLKQKIIWKYHEPIEGISSNVKIVSWMPQRDILGHSKLRIFMTHGGRLSSLEIIYHGVPILGIPLFADQIQNMNRLKELDIGVDIDIVGLTADKIYDAVTTVLNDNRYAKTAKELSAIFRDTQNNPADTVNYWTEYVIRHNGAAHLKNQMAQELPCYQYNLLDVWAVILGGLLLVAVVFVFAIKLLIRLFFKLKSKGTKKKKE